MWRAEGKADSSGKRRPRNDLLRASISDMSRDMIRGKTRAMTREMIRKLFRNLRGREIVDFVEVPGEEGERAGLAPVGSQSPLLKNVVGDLGRVA